MLPTPGMDACSHLPLAWVWFLLPLGTRPFISAHRRTLLPPRTLQGAGRAAKQETHCPLICPAVCLLLPTTLLS